MIREIQLGKNGINQNFIESLKKQFNKVQTVKVSVLQSARQSKKDVENYAKEIVGKLGPYFTAKVIGFTIILKKWRKPRT